MGGGDLSWVGGRAVDYVPATVAGVRGDGGVWVLCRVERVRFGDDFPVGAGDEAEDVGGVGLYLCGADADAYALSDVYGGAVVGEAVCSDAEGGEVSGVVSV